MHVVQERNTYKAGILVPRSEMEEHDASRVSVPRRLPVFEGYTVDVRCREFRKMILGELPDFVSFASAQGDALLVRYVESLSPEEFDRFMAEYDGEHADLRLP